MQKYISQKVSAILVTSLMALSQCSISLVVCCETTYNTACGISNGTVAAEKAGRWMGGKKEFSRRSSPTKVTVGVKDDAPPLVPSYQGLLEGDIVVGPVFGIRKAPRIYNPDSVYPY
ncbi:hypothetical protein M0802_000288 [Mischocyttarus mexicanus]|nr:hypothetical protein M0802_000288 [Mischocyttarus mexicanus]